MKRLFFTFMIIAGFATCFTACDTDDDDYMSSGSSYYGGSSSNNNNNDDDYENENYYYYYTTAISYDEHHNSRTIYIYKRPNNSHDKALWRKKDKVPYTDHSLMHICPHHTYNVQDWTFDYEYFVLVNGLTYYFNY